MEVGKGKLVNIVRPVNLLLTGGPYRKHDKEFLERVRKKLKTKDSTTPALELLLNAHPDVLTVFAYKDRDGKTRCVNPTPSDIKTLQKKMQRLLECRYKLSVVNADLKSGKGAEWKMALDSYLKKAFDNHQLHFGVASWYDHKNNALDTISYPAVSSFVCRLLFQATG